MLYIVDLSALLLPQFITVTQVGSSANTRLALILSVYAVLPSIQRWLLVRVYFVKNHSLSCCLYFVVLINHVAYCGCSISAESQLASRKPFLLIIT